MRIKKEYIVHNSHDECIIVSTDNSIFRGMIRANKSASFIVECLREDTTIEEIVSQMETKYAVSVEKLRNDVSKIIEQLNIIGALDA